MNEKTLESHFKRLHNKKNSQIGWHTEKPITFKQKLDLLQYDNMSKFKPNKPISNSTYSNLIALYFEYFKFIFSDNNMREKYQNVCNSNYNTDLRDSSKEGKYVHDLYSKVSKQIRTNLKFFLFYISAEYGEKKHHFQTNQTINRCYCH